MKKLLFLLLTVCGSAMAVPDSVVESCTTNERIYKTSVIRTSKPPEEKRDAILKALGVSTSDPHFNVKHFKGQWFYETEDEHAVYAGYNIRKHYLSVAVIYSENNIITIVCDSANLRQKPYSIHRKAEPWKDDLNVRIRLELGKQDFENYEEQP